MIDDGRQAIIDIAYLIAAVFFIFGLKFLSSPRQARRGNQLAAIGMGLAILATFLSRDWESGNYILIIVGILIGGIAAGWAARVVKMTAMPQMTAIYNGMGGATAALVSLGEFSHKTNIGNGEKVAIVVGCIIGSISFTGSIIAFAKLQELLPGKPIRIANQQMYNIIAAVALVVLTVLAVGLDHNTTSKLILWVVFVIALALGFSVVLPIGGADMPVVIAILNSLTGLAAAVAGLALGNQAMVIAGALVGASGSYLTYLMAKAMNRSVANVIFGSWGAHATGGVTGGPTEQLPIRETTADDVAVQLAYADKVIIVPGYGLAVAQAQHAVRELADVLQERGVDVKYAIHPVAGRMPGHMNVLLAEANVPYEDLYEMEAINDDFPTTNVALVIGANDVTNPAARDDKTSPIYGMPILNVDEAQNVVVLKRSMKSGYAGIENMLFHDPKTSMLFGDAKTSLTDLINAVKAA
ncbi:MAG TPA: NAD(P)(+) transhydrogenase (Re/Si-specific) subunit beta [Thermomicrobiales bacterium]|jgi:NAD(P) transhydrogenase subunit beta|nr:NAD(P)(+) transhydrogenase (Re/Si-specific) subunit beta [Thermomicrobiales bacterium]